MFMIYSFCNLHDVSWGTKGATTEGVDSVPLKKMIDESGNTVFELDIATKQEYVGNVWTDTAMELVKNK
jgi:chitin synthase